jgi:cobalt-zinc-cadmium efflux system outer membrane protein
MSSAALGVPFPGHDHGDGGFMKLVFRRLCEGLSVSTVLATAAFAQGPLNWQQIREKFEAANPSLRAGQIGVDESRAAEITAYLRPNPQFTFTTDGLQLTPDAGHWRPLAGLVKSPGVSQLIERQHKRELRRGSARQATAVATSQLADQERNLLFNLRQAFIQTLQGKAVVGLTKENLSYYDHLLGVNRDRYHAGAIAQVDLDRLELQRVQYESDLRTAEVNLRTAKIQLLALLNDRTPVEQFDVAGPFDFSVQTANLDEFRRVALDTRPDLKAAMQSVEKAKTDNRLAWANGSTDPVIASWYSRNPSFNNPFDLNSLGASISIPIRIFDRNQGEKLRTRLDIDRNGKLMQATRAQVFSDVDSAYAALTSTVTLLQPYRDRYLQQASRIRDTISFSYEHGAASLLDFLNAQSDYRGVQLSYLNLVGSYLEAANQLNLAVGREVIQ